MDDGLLTEIARKLRELGDLKHEANVDQCRLLGPLWGDRKSLSRIAEWTEASEQNLCKLAGAGAVLLAGYWDGVVRSVEWAYQFSLFESDRWEQLFAWDVLAELTAGELSSLRRIDEKMGVVGKRMEVVDA